MRLDVATCQFPTGADVRAHLGHVPKQMREARAGGGNVAHFPETRLSGYVGADAPSHEELHCDLLAEAVREVMALTAGLRPWVVLGSAQRLTGANKSHNSLYVIDDRGRIVDRYDKRFCSGDASGA